MIILCFGFSVTIWISFTIISKAGNIKYITKYLKIFQFVELFIYFYFQVRKKKYNLGEIFKKRYVTKHHSSLYIHFLGIWTHHLMALNIWCERTSCLVIPAPDKPLNSRLVYLTADWTSPLRCVIGISYITFLRITHVCPASQPH